MEHDFWHERWEKNEIGFHEESGNPFLKKYCSLVKKADAPRVFVPLCGKTKDIGYLLSLQCDVVGAELSERAVQQLFDELDVPPHVTQDGPFKVYRFENVTIFVGDVFELTATQLGRVTAVYDRAALVALPFAMRQRYTAHIADITAKADQLLLTFDYDQQAMDGPPFAVSECEVRDHYEHRYTVSLLQEQPVEGGLKGQVDARALVFSLTAR
ncbi:thiopurine S-methyltransferase [Alteromonas sp. CYL-A6]|uniref:thiopurine S-methyltransferase n=1 Tax=Alteromonas nitratireducens TaxID=3390813 RepID=UPI0034B1C4B5